MHDKQVQVRDNDYRDEPGNGVPDLILLRTKLRQTKPLEPKHTDTAEPEQVRDAEPLLWR